jgi:single-stranded-DNA-specific exonuclease
MIINKKKINMPIPSITIREMDKARYQEAVMAGIEPVHAKIIANRNIPSYISPLDILNPQKGLTGLDVYQLKDIKKAADRIADAVINKEHVAFLCDFDVDGISSAAVLYRAMTFFFSATKEYIHPVISNRMVDGYGFSAAVLDKVLNMTPIPTLLVTADQGSKDGKQVDGYLAGMAELGLKGDVIITDHHHINGRGSESAYAVVNPQREDCEFVDKTICGCTVAMFVMVATRDSLKEKGYLPSDAPKLTELLTYSTAATVADCVSMASPINRAIVLRGLKDINNGTKAPWRVMRESFVEKGQLMRVDSIGFGLGPRINACSRTGGDGMLALKYYLAENDPDALRYLSMLDAQNDERKKIEKKLVQDALVQASEYYSQGCNSLVIYLENGHHGIHGIAASRICERYGRPVIILSPKDKTEVITPTTTTVKGVKKVTKKKSFTVQTVTGSARSIESIDIHACMERAEKRDRNLFLKFGGHSMAAGMSLNFKKVSQLRQLIEEEVTSALNGAQPYPEILCDGEIKPQNGITYDLLYKVLALQPYGNQFEEPTFKIKAEIQDIAIKGKNKDTGILKIRFGGTVHSAVWFKYDQSPMFNEINNGDMCEMAIQISEKVWQGRHSIGISILHAQTI